MAVVEADSTSMRRGKGLRVMFAEIAEAETGRGMVWAPVLIIAGIWIYFALTREPPVLLSCAGFGGALIVLWRTKGLTAWKIVALVVLGFSLAGLRTYWISTPLIRAYMPAANVTGQVVDVEVRSKQRFTIVLDIATITGLATDDVPRRINISVTGRNAAPRIGDSVSLVADLFPLPRPAAPGAFDFGRQLFFRSIGGMGRSKGPVAINPDDISPRFLLRRWAHTVRANIGARIKAAIPGPLGSFADALITGERATIPRGMNNSLQASGLFHILSISGLHMALVAGGAFWAMRAVLACSQRLALYMPIKKWAAAFAIIVGFLYMLLADSGAATERSFIMIAVVFFAILIDRPALSLHNLALAAAMILQWSPEQALSASFQMSFMAVMGLAAFFLWWDNRFGKNGETPKRGLVMRWGLRGLSVAVASIATSLIAGILSGVPALHHFGRVAPYSVIANALALPIVSLVVMPAAMVSVLLMPLGLETLPLEVMGVGLKLVMLVSDWIASWPGASLRVPVIGAAGAAALALASAMLLLPASQLRWFGVPVLAGALLILAVPRPHALVLVDERAGNVAVMTDEGLVPALSSSGAASVSRWLQQYGDIAGAKMAFGRQAWTCSKSVCEAQAKGLRVGYLLRGVSILTPCPRVDVLVSQEPLRRRCKGRVQTIDRFDVWRSGAHAVFADGSVTSARREQGERPWVYEPRARPKLQHVAAWNNGHEKAK